MKRTFLCLLVALAITAAGAQAQQAATEISAGGTGSVSMAPDMATVDAAVETYAPAAPDAVSQNNAIYDRIVAALTQLGIARDDISLSYYNVSYNPRPATGTPSADERYGYTVSRGFSVSVRDIGKAGRVSDACVAAGATGINGVRFGLSNPAPARAAAMTKAVGEARSDAESLASAAGLHIVGIKRIDLGGGAQGPMPMMRVAAMAPSTTFDQSSVNVTVNVTVVFEAQP